MATREVHYPDAYRREREAERAAEEAAEKRNQEENAEARKQYLAGLEAEKAARDRANQEAIEVALADDRMRLQRDWLAARPGLTEADFLKDAWPLLKANLLDERDKAARAATVDSMRHDARYSNF